MIQIPVEPAVTEYLHAKASARRIPISGTFELTPVCNMNCRMCYVRMSKEEQEAEHRLYSADEWIELGKKARDKGLLFLLVTGGEPFIRPDIRQILEGLHSLGLLISLNSNGTLITEETIKWLKDCPPVRINITLYGASNETYARLCRNPLGFTQATKAILMLQEAGITVKVNCSLTPDNVDDLYDIVKWTKDHGLLVQATSYMFPPVRKDASKIGVNRRFTSEEAAYYAAKIEQYINNDELFLQRYEEEKDGMMLGSGEDDCLTVEEGMPIQCRAGKCSFWVTWNGKFLPCGMMPISENTANVFEVGFDQAWKEAMAFAESIRLPAECTNCSLKKTCKACAAMVYTESGNFHTVPEYRCRMAHAYSDACRQVAEEITAKAE